jgi:Arc/MetJ-type ribon-helix-helix transcriptional regulator
MVQLTDDLVEQLDGEAARRGLSRSAVIREAIEDHLAVDQEQLIARQIVEGYTRIPPATPDEWGDIGGLTSTCAREVMQRLDAEEVAQGLEPW